VADAAFHGNRQQVASLIDSGKDVNARDDVNGWTGLMWAASQGYPEIAEYLLAHGADPNLKDDQGHTALYIASIRDRLEIVKLLLAQKADVNSRDRDGSTPLLATHTSAIRQALVAAGADVNVKNKAGATPLAIAALAGDARSIELLLQRGSQVDEKIQGKTPLIALCNLEGLGSTIVHVAKSVSWDSMSDVQKVSAFDQIAQPIMNQYVAAARHLVKAGANLSANDDLGQTALHWAVASLTVGWLKIGGLRAITKLPLYEERLSAFSRTFLAVLLDAGAPMNAINSKGLSPLGLLRMLRKNEVSLGPQLAPLAAYNDDIDRFLVERGAR
jgi:ankyrin repeat protein